MPHIATVTLALLLASTGLAQDPPPDAADARCHIHGRLVDEHGAPVAGARVFAHGWGANQQRIQRHGVPQSWTDPEVTTGADGAFELRFVPPQAFQFTIKVQHADFADLGWRWSQINEGEERDQGTVTLERPGIIEGHIVNPAGDLLVDPWRVQASLATRGEHHQGISTKHCSIDPATGSFRFADLPPGRVSLQAIRGTGERAEEVFVTTVAGEVTQVTLTYDGPDPARTIMMRISSTGPAGIATSQLDESAPRAVAEDGTVHRFERIPQRGWEYWAKDLPQGAYRVEVDDPRFERWQQEDVRPGDSVRVTLVGRVQLRVEVLGPDGAAVPRYRLTVQQTEPFRTSRVEELQSASTPPPADGLYRGLLAGSFEVSVTAEGFGAYRGTLEDLNADAPGQLVVHLAPTRTLEGRVLHADGRPVGEGSVQLTLGDLAGHDMEENSMAMTMIEDDRGRRQVPQPYRDFAIDLDVSGSFRFDGVTAGPAVLRVLHGEFVRHDVRVDIAQQAGPLLVTLPPLGSIEGLVLFASERPEGTLYVLPERSWLEHFGGLRTATRQGAVTATGHFRIGPVGAGPLILTFLSASEKDGNGQGFGTSSWRTLERMRVDVAAGAPTEFVLDTTDASPSGRAIVAVTLGGAPPSEPLTIYLAPIDPFDARGRQRKPGFGQVEGGAAEIASVSAGEYKVSVHGALLTFEVPETLTIVAFDVVRLTVDVPVVRRALRALDGEGAPRASVKLWLGGHANPIQRVPIETDAEGRVTLALPAGRYRVYTKDFDPFIADAASASGSEFDWAPGEVPLDVRIE